MTKVLVIGEMKDGALKKSTLEIISKAGSMNHEVAIVAIGDEVTPLISSMVEAGTTTQYIAEDPSLNTFIPSTWCSIITQAAKEYKADQIWFGLSENNKATAPAVATRLESECYSGIIAIDQKDEEVIVTKPVMAGKALQKIKFIAKPAVLIFQSGLFECSSLTGKKQVVKLSPPKTDLRAVIKEVINTTGGEIELSDAEVIVGIGRGVRNEQGIDLCQALASDLNAGFGASKALVDLNLMSHNSQIGQTGKMISPSLYLAIGISGAIQHTAGINRSQTIVAINKDPEAPIFDIADYGIVGDLFEVIPVLRKEIQTLYR